MKSRCLLTLLALLAALCPWATAQEAEEDEAPGGFPLIRRHQLDLYAEVLELDAEQRDILPVLWQGYRLAIREQTGKMREMQERLMKAYEENAEKIQQGDGSAIEALQQEVMEAQMQSPRRLIGIDAAFGSDLKAILNESQQDNWVRYERARRRHMFMGQAEFPGWAGVDLVDAVISLKLPPEEYAKLGPELLDYEQRVDRPLKEMWDFLMSMLEKFSAGEQPDEEDVETTLTAKLSLLAEVNKGAVARTTALLEGESSRKLRDEATRRAFPFVYRVSPINKSISAALAFEDLTDDQRAEITAMTPTYDTELQSANKAWAQLFEERIDELGPDRMQIYQDMENLPAPAQARLELDSRYRKRLESVLTPEQIERLPPAPTTQYYQEWHTFEDGHIERNPDNR